MATTVLTGCFGSGATGENQGDGDFADDGCTHIAVATSSEKVNMLDALADGVQGVARGEGARHVRDRASGERLIG